jgi:hypothetical protein
MRLVATTVVRESKKRVTGFIYDVDWTSGEIVRRLPVPEPRFPEADDNPRGGVRGGRGVASTPRGIVVANYDTLYRYDDEWNLVDEFSHPLFVDLHEIDWDGEALWVTATGIDAVLRVSPDWEVEVAWDPYRSPLAERLGIGKRSHAIDGSLDYRIREAPLIDRCHINSVIRRNGSTVVNFGLVRTPRSDSARLADQVLAKLKGWDGRGRFRKRPGRTLIARLDAEKQADVLIDVPPHLVPWHNGQVLGESHIVVNDSTSKALRLFALPDGREVKSVHVPARWLRGLVPLDPNRLLVGLGPAAIALVDLERGAVERTVQLSDERREAVHGLALRQDVQA